MKWSNFLYYLCMVFSPLCATFSVFLLSIFSDWFSSLVIYHTAHLCISILYGFGKQVLVVSVLYTCHKRSLFGHIETHIFSICISFLEIKMYYVNQLVNSHTKLTKFKVSKYGNARSLLEGMGWSEQCQLLA